MRMIILWIMLAAGLFVPVAGVRVVAAFVLMTFFPGFFIWQYVDPEEKNPLVFMGVGAAFLTVFVYFCAWWVWFPIPLVGSFICAVLVEKKGLLSLDMVMKNGLLPSVDRKTLYLFGCVLFMIAYMYPWLHSEAFYPPGDEMKLHLIYTDSILQEKALPADYSPLYPEIKNISQPLGVHGIFALVADASRTPSIPVSIYVGILIASLGCGSIYILGKTFFSEEIGLAAAFSFAFLSFVAHQFGLSGSYIGLAGVTFHMYAVALIVRAASEKTRTTYILAGGLCAACFSTDLSAFFPLILFLILFVIMNRSAIPILAAFVIFSLPQLARFALLQPTALELYFIEEWVSLTFITTPQRLGLVIFSMGPLLFIFALLQLFSSTPNKTWLNQQNRTITVYSICFCIPLVLSFALPIWHFFDPVVIFRMLFIPLCVISGLFLIRLKVLCQFKWFIYGLVVCAIVMHLTDPFIVLPAQSVTAGVDAEAAYQWIRENTTPEDVVCNFASSGDSSTWIPAAADRRIFFPFHLYYPKDNAMSTLKLPQRFTDLAVIKSVPDSHFAREIMNKYKLAYVYIDEESGVDWKEFENSALYDLSFHQGNVYIFSITDKEPPQYIPVSYHRAGSISNGLRWYFHFPRVAENSVLGIYYWDKGVGNVDVEINDQYAGTFYRFDTSNHFAALFVLPPGDIKITLFPYENPLYIDNLVIFELSAE